jgi:hypothetical protein
LAPFAEIVDVGALLSVVVASFVAGAGLTAAFSVVILCSTRAAERRRAGSRVAAVGLGTVAVVAGLACVALVAFGIQVMVSK